MRIVARKQALETARADLLVVNLFAGETRPGGGTGTVDKKYRGLITKKIKSLDFKGKTAGEFFIFDTPLGKPSKQIMVVSLGEKKDFYLDAIRKAAATSLLEAKKLNSKNIATILHGAGIGGLDPELCAQSMTEGFLLADYSFDKFKAELKKENKNKAVREIIICQKDSNKLKEIKTGISLGRIFSQGQIFARDLVNEPPVKVYPEVLANLAKQIAKDNPNISVTILKKSDIEKLKMNSFLAVDAGSDKDPYFIHLTYKPEGKIDKKIALVGKSITFDSGGLSLKPSESMLNMKMDMAGGATVLGIFSVLGDLKPNLEIHGILPACENMPSGGAMKIDDVVEASNGKTIEIVNTDAEGRMALADALVYAEKLKPDVMIDLATLTGAAIVALGNDIASLMTDDIKLKEWLTTAARTTGEKIWPLPLEPDYKAHIKSEVADIKNVGKKGAAGTISAGLFLQHFVKKTPWAHLDIAGPAWNETKSNPYQPIGGSGFGVRLLLEYLLMNK